MFGDLHPIDALMVGLLTGVPLQPESRSRRQPHDREFANRVNRNRKRRKLAKKQKRHQRG